MTSYIETTIGEIVTYISSGGTPKSTEQSFYENGNIPWLNTKEVNFNRIYKTEKNITDLGLKNSSAKWIAENSVIVAMYGATAGRVAISKIKLTTNQACCNLTIDENKADYRYVYYYLSNKFDELVNLANGAAQQNLSTLVIKKFPIRVPDLRSQKIIADILEKIDDKIELNIQMNKTLEGMARAIFKEWFIDFGPVRAKAEGRRPIGMDEDTSKLFSDGFEESELGMIPKGWRVGKIEELCDRVKSGGTPSRSNDKFWSEGNIPWLSSGEVRDRFLISTKEKITKLAMENSNAGLLPKFTTIVAMYGATAGQVALSGIDLTTNQACCGLVPQKNKKFFLYNLVSSLVDQLLNLANGAAQQNISQQIIREFKVIIPPDNLISIFDLMVEHNFHLIFNNCFESESLLASRNILLPKLISGELEIGAIHE